MILRYQSNHFEEIEATHPVFMYRLVKPGRSMDILVWRTTSCTISDTERLAPTHSHVAERSPQPAHIVDPADNNMRGFFQGFNKLLSTNSESTSDRFVVPGPGGLENLIRLERGLVGVIRHIVRKFEDLRCMSSWLLQERSNGETQCAGMEDTLHMSS